MRKLRLAALGRQPSQLEAGGRGAGPETAASLLAAGLDARAAELASATPLQRAAAEGHVDIVHQLLKHGADVNHQDSLHGNSALHEAAWRGYSQTAVILCRQRANVNAVNRAGFTPLHLCCQNGHNETCRVLLLANANPDAKNHYGDTPLHTSGRYGHAGVMRILISAKCNVAEQNKNGDTALHIAAAMGRRKLTRILLGAGCPMNVKNKQGELAVDIARRKEYHEIVTMLQKPSSARDGSSSARTKSKSRSKREKTDSSKDGSRNSKENKERKRRKESKRSKDYEYQPNGYMMSPYGCHDNPDLARKLNPKMNSLPSEPLKQGEQYYLDLGGNIQKGPVGVQSCFCGPLLHRLECRLAKDKQEILQRLDTAHMRLDAKIDGLERKTQQQLLGLQRTVDSLGLESSEAGLQRVRNSIVMADPGHGTPPLPSIDLSSHSSHRFDSSDASDGKRRSAKNEAKVKHQMNDVQYTLDKLGIDGPIETNGTVKHQRGLAALRDHLEATRMREQKELDAIVEHYERRQQNGHHNGDDEDHDERDEDESEESDDDEISTNVLPPPNIISSQQASMLSDSRYENYDYPPAITKPLASYVAPSYTTSANGISYRNLPLPRYHLDAPSLAEPANGVGTVELHHDKMGTKLLGVIVDPVLYARHFSGHDHLRYQDERDRHNDSGYSTRPGESSQGPSPSLSGPAESMEGDPVMSPRTARRCQPNGDAFQAHFTRDLAQNLPASVAGNTCYTNGYSNNNSTSYANSNGAAYSANSNSTNGTVNYPRVRFAVPNSDPETHFPPGTISSSSLV